MFSKAVKPLACTVATTLLVATCNFPAVAVVDEENKYDALTFEIHESAGVMSLADKVSGYVENHSQDIAAELEELPFSEANNSLLQSVDHLVTVVGDTVTFPLPGSDNEVVQVKVPSSTATPELASDQESIVFADSEGSETLHEVKAIDGGIPQLTSVQLSPETNHGLEEHRYEFSLPSGYELVELADGSIGIVGQIPETPAYDEEETTEILREVLPTEEDVQSVLALATEDKTPEDFGIPEGTELITYFQSPWAVDSNGNELPTSLSVDGNSVVQQVNTAGAVFPVVADPLPLVAIALGTAARALAPHAIRAFAVHAIRAGAQYTARGGYRTFDAFKRAAGTRAGYQWHHIVEQSTIRTRAWDPRAIHNPNNLVQIPTQVHQRCINSWMARKGVRQFGAYASSSQTMRQWVQKQSFSTQHRIGVNLLRHCGVHI